MSELLSGRSPATRRTASGPDSRLVPTPRPSPLLKASLAELGQALVDRGARATLRAVDHVREKLEDVALDGGVLPGAAGGGVAAFLAGRNPLWGVVKGVISGTSTTTKVIVVLAIVLALVLGPVVLVLLLVALIVVGVVVALRSGAGT